MSVRGLVKRYDNRVVARDGVDLTVFAGGCFGLLGPNGAGKTTTIEILVGLLSPTGREVRVLDSAWGPNDHALRSRIGVLLQEARFPEAFQPLIRALLLTALTDALRGVMSEGRSIAALWPQFLVLGVWGAVCLAVALWIFRWS